MISKRTIKRWNDKFNSLTKSEQRVEIAKDIIRSLKAEKYIAQTNTYIISEHLNVELNEDIRENFDKIENCRCCMLGSCLLSITKYKNKLKFTDITGLYSTGNAWKLLATVFTPYQALMMETAFEGRGGTKVGEDYFNIGLSDKDEDKCQNFYIDSGGAEKRMIAICSNIIQNRGKFVP